VTRLPVTEYDQRILDITKELCLQLDILNYNPTFVSWETTDSRYRGPVEFRYDECLVEKYCLTMSAKMRETLEPDELRPIIASSLVFSKVLRPRGVRQIVLTLVALVVVAIVFAVTLPDLFPLGILLLPTVTLPLSIFYARRLRRLADRRACDLVSAATFLTTLNKVAATTSQSGYQETGFLRGPRGPIAMLPDIQTRIARIQKHSQTTPLRAVASG
jgi:hypothetical protein